MPSLHIWWKIHRFVWECFNGLIPKGLQIDHKDNCKTNNKIKTLQLLTPKQNQNKSNKKSITSKNIGTKEKQIFDSLTKAPIELKISISIISKICNKTGYFKNAKSKNDGELYRLKFKTSQENANDLVKILNERKWLNEWFWKRVFITTDDQRSCSSS